MSAKSQMQVSEMKFMQKIKKVTMFDKHRNTTIRESLNIQSLFLRIEISQLRWLGHVSRMPHEWLPKQTLYAEVSGKMQIGRPRTRWLDFIEDRDWNRLGLHPSKTQSVMVGRELRRLNLELLPPQPFRKSGRRKRKPSLCRLL